MDSPVTGLEALDEMRMGVSLRLPLTIRKFTILVRPLSITETLNCALDAQARLSKLPEISQNRAIEHTLLAKLTLIQASTSEPGKNDAKISEHVIDQMTPDELDYAFKQYVAVTDKVNPSLEALPGERIQEMVEALKKSPSEAIDRSFLDLVNIVRFLLTKDG